MSDEASRSDKEKSDLHLDLSGLGDLSLGPNWGSGAVPATPFHGLGDRDRDRHRDRGRERDRPRRERHDARGPTGAGGSRERGSFRDRRGPMARPPRGEGRGDRGQGFRPREDFKPLLVADFYPDDNAFKALSQAIKTSCRTFELFEIARLILEKPDRWVCVAKHPDQKEGEDAILHASVPDGLPFLSEGEAVQHVLTHFLDEFFTVENYEAEAPAGSFPMVHRCGITGALIGPPNFHRYQALLKEHHAKKVPHLPLFKVQERLESVREPEVIDAWMEQMKEGRRFILKLTPEGVETPPQFNDFESARLYLLTHAKDKLVRPAYSVRFLGRDLARLPEEDLLRRSIDALHAHQLRFPLETANNLRSRLRRLNLAVYKKGSKGVSFVCAVKRHFREPDEVLAENLSDLIVFIEAHKNIRAADLPKQYLGLESTQGEPAANPTKLAAAPGSETGTEPAAEAAPAPEPEVAAPAEVATPRAVEEPAAPDENALLALKRDLRYLVTQGYVIEYSDGRLSVPPPREVPKPKPEPKKKEPSAPVAKVASAPPPEAPPAPEAKLPSLEATPPTPAENPPAPEPPAAEAVAEAASESPEPESASDAAEKKTPPVAAEPESGPASEPESVAEVSPPNKPDSA